MFCVPSQNDCLVVRCCARQVTVGRWVQVRPVNDMEKNMKTLNRRLARANAVKLLGWCPRDSLKQWLKAVGEMAQCHGQ